MPERAMRPIANTRGFSKAAGSLADALAAAAHHAVPGLPAPASHNPAAPGLPSPADQPVEQPVEAQSKRPAACSDAPARTNRAAAPSRGAQTLSALGFGCCIAWFLLQETILSATEVNLFNYCLYGCIGQLAACITLGAAGARGGFAPSSALMRVAGVAGAAGIALQLVPLPLAGIVGGLVTGAATGTLLVAWGVRLSALGARSAFIRVLAAVLAATVLAFACHLTCEALPQLGLALGVALPLAVGFTPWQGARPPAASDRHAILPWPFLLVLGASCLLSSFFQGVAASPYAFQSDAVAFYRLAYTGGALALLLLLAAVMERPRTQVFFLAALALLLIGLFLFSSGILGSIIMPLGMILAARTCCFALAFVTLVMLAKVSGFAPALVMGCGLAALDGTLGKGSGLLVSGMLQPSFPDLALVASICIVAFTMLYIVMVVVHPDANNTLNVDLTMPVVTMPELDRETLIERHLDEMHLTPKEREAAEMILEGLTYSDIAERMGTKERTIKFHAANIFKKGGVANRREFESSIEELCRYAKS